MLSFIGFFYFKKFDLSDNSYLISKLDSGGLILDIGLCYLFSKLKGVIILDALLEKFSKLS